MVVNDEDKTLLRIYISSKKMVHEGYWRRF